MSSTLPSHPWLTRLTRSVRTIAELRPGVRGWLRLWRSRPLTVTSPLPAPTAHQRLQEAVAHDRVVLRRTRSDYAAGRVVIGRVGRHRVRLVALRPVIRNSFRPVFHGHLRPNADGGCELVGRIGWVPWVKIWVIASFGFLTYGQISVAGIVIDELSHRTGAFPTADVLTSPVPLAFMAFLVLLSGIAGCAGLNDEAYLRDWVNQTLDVPVTRL